MMEPHGAQLTVLDDASQYRVVIAPRHTGKTTLAAFAALREPRQTAYFTNSNIPAAAATFDKVGSGGRVILNPPEWKATGTAVSLFVVDEPSTFSIERIIELFRWAGGRRVLFAGTPKVTVPAHLAALDTLHILYGLDWYDLSAYNWHLGDAGIAPGRIVSGG